MFTFSRPLPLATFLLAVPLFATPLVRAQRSSSSSSSSTQQDQGPSSSVVPRRGVEASGSAVSLETSESMFDVAAGLNACGYDNGLESSLPVRGEVRAEMTAAVAKSPAAGLSRGELCGYIQTHAQGGAQNLAQYVSLALFLGPPPELALSIPEGELPPDAIQVAGVLPMLRDFAEKIDLHAIYVRHRVEMEAAVTQTHDSLTRMLLETNLYLHQPVSSYDGRRFMVLLEPMLSPQAVNARIYGNDYFVVTSPAPIDPANPPRVSPGSRMTVSAHAGGLQMDQVRHIYLLYTIDPIIYARAGATNRLLPLLKTVSDAPIDFTYKSDIVALTTECLIKAIEARTMDVGIPKPGKPASVKAAYRDRREYNEAIIDYDHKSEAIRRKQVVLDMESGWVLTESFYDKLALQDREGISLKESIGEMVYGMDVNARSGPREEDPVLQGRQHEPGRRWRRQPRARASPDADRDGPGGAAVAERRAGVGGVAGRKGIADRSEVRRSAVCAGPRQADGGRSAGRVRPVHSGDREQQRSPHGGVVACVSGPPVRHAATVQPRKGSRGVPRRACYARCAAGRAGCRGGGH